jgi:hypothetical protein
VGPDGHRDTPAWRETRRLPHAGAGCRARRWSADTRGALDHVGLADELGDEARARGDGTASAALPDLGHAAPVEHGDAIRDHHGLGLIVGHVQRGDAEGLVQAADLEAHLLAEVGVQVGQGLVEQQDLRLDDERRAPPRPAAAGLPRARRDSAPRAGERTTRQHLGSRAASRSARGSRS